MPAKVIDMLGRIDEKPRKSEAVKLTWLRAWHAAGGAQSWLEANEWARERVAGVQALCQVLLDLCDSSPGSIKPKDLIRTLHVMKQELDAVQHHLEECSTNHVPRHVEMANRLHGVSADDGEPTTEQS